MIKIFLAGIRRSHLTHDQYRHWSEVQHAGLVRGGPSSYTSLISAYRQNHTLSGVYGDGCDFEIDSVSELTWESFGHFAGTMAHPYQIEFVTPDGPAIADMEKSIVFLAGPVPMDETSLGNSAYSSPQRKVVHYLKRAEGTRQVDFVSAWRDARQHALERVNSSQSRLTRYEEGHSLPFPGQPDHGYAGVANLWLTEETADSALSDYLNTVMNELDGKGVLDPSKSFHIVADEVTII